MLTLPNEKTRDTVVHKIGQTILRCVPLHDLVGMADTHSVFLYLPFGPVIESESTSKFTASAWIFLFFKLSPIAGHGVSSDSSEDDNDIEQGELSLSSRKKKNKSVPPINPYRR